MIPNYSYIYSFCTHVIIYYFSHFLSPCISLCMFLARVYNGHVFIAIFLIFAHCISLSHSILHTVHLRTSLDMQVRPRADFCTSATCCSHFFYVLQHYYLIRTKFTCERGCYLTLVWFLFRPRSIPTESYHTPILIYMF